MQIVNSIRMSQTPSPPTAPESESSLRSRIKMQQNLDDTTSSLALHSAEDSIFTKNLK